MPEYVNERERFRDSRFESVDFSGSRFRDCGFRGAKIVDAWLEDVHLSGFVRRVVVNDVDVTEYVEAELDRRYPHRAQVRQLATPDDFRSMWATIEAMWAAAVERARALPEAARHERVDEEWSFVETLRHLVFATDAWVFRTVLDDPMPFHPLGLTQTGYPAAEAAAIGIDLDGDPTFAEVLEVRADRLARVRDIVAGLTAEELARECTRPPAPGYPEEPNTVGTCLQVVMGEECEHHRYAVRDLEVLEART